MNIEKRSRDSYRIRQTFQGVQYSVTVDHKPSKKEARGLIEEAIAEGIGRRIERRNKHDFKSCARAYIDARSNVISVTTISEYKSMLRRLSEEFRNTPISEISNLEVQDEINRLAATRGAKTVRNYHGFISAVLKMYRPELVLRTQLPQRARSTPYIPTDNDIKRIMQEAKGTMFEVPLLLACYGLRRSEICALTPEDFEGNIVHITKALVQNERNEWVIKQTKTAASTRDIIVDDYLVDLVELQGYVFQGHPNSITDYLYKVQRRLGIRRFSIHKLRHYFCSKLFDSQVPEAAIMALGGWQTDSVMKTVYRHAMEDRMNERKRQAVTIISSVIY